MHLVAADMAQEVRAVVWQSEGCRFDPTLGVSKCPWARHLILTSWLVPCMAANRHWCVNGWMRGINCTTLWIKALYKCSPFTIYHMNICVYLDCCIKKHVVGLYIQHSHPGLALAGPIITTSQEGKKKRKVIPQHGYAKSVDNKALKDSGEGPAFPLRLRSQTPQPWRRALLCAKPESRGPSHKGHLSWKKKKKLLTEEKSNRSLTLPVPRNTYIHLI